MFSLSGIKMKGVVLMEVHIAGLRKKGENISLRNELFTSRRLINLVFLANQMNF